MTNLLEQLAPAAPRPLLYMATPFPYEEVDDASREQADVAYRQLEDMGWSPFNPLNPRQPAGEKLTDEQWRYRCMTVLRGCDLILYLQIDPLWRESDGVRAAHEESARVRKEWVVERVFDAEDWTAWGCYMAIALTNRDRRLHH